MSYHSYSAGYDQGFQHATGKLLKELAEVKADLEKTTMRCIDSDSALAEAKKIIQDVSTLIGPAMFSASNISKAREILKGGKS